MGSAGGCRVYRVAVPEPVAYFAHFAGSRDAMFYDSVEAYVESRARADEEARALLDGALSEAGSRGEAFVRAFCELRGFATALVFEDFDDERFDVVVFGLPEGEAERVAAEVGEYVKALGEAMSRAGAGEELESCYYLDAGSDVARCLAMAREALGAGG